jgi:hypothetical protein
VQEEGEKREGGREGGRERENLLNNFLDLDKLFHFLEKKYGADRYS